MKTTHSQFVGSIPEIYDAHLGPLFFDFSAADLAARVSRAVRGGEILEVACGTGISTEHLRKALPETTHILATDLNEAMVEFAESRRGTLPNVDFQQADALALPFEDESFDAVICQFGVMFFPDKAAGMAEMTRVLRPGGLLAFNVWDSPKRNPIVEIGLEAMGHFFEADPPTFMKMPFGYADIDPIKELIQGIGFTSFDVHVVSAVIESGDPVGLARGFVEGNPGIHEVNERATADVETIVAAVAEAFQATFGPAPLKIPLQEIVFLAAKSG